MGDEEFKVCVHNENYLIGDLGTIMRVDNFVMRNGFPVKYPRMQLRPRLMANGFYYVAFCGHKHMLHRLVAQHFVVGETEELRCVKHIDGNKWNNVASNLCWVRKRHNKHDKV